MQSDIVGQVLSVTGQPTRRGSMMYKVAFSDGNEYTTFDNALAKQANALTNQQVQARVEVGPSRDGRYTNYNILAVGNVGELPPADLMQNAGSEIPIVQPQQRNGNRPGGGGGKGFTEADKARITKLAVYGQAIDLIGRLYEGAGSEAIEEAYKAVEEIAGRLYTSARSHEATVLQPEVAPLPVATPQAIAAAVPGVEVGAPNVTSDAVVPWQ